MFSKKTLVVLSLTFGLVLLGGCKKKVEEAPSPTEAPAATPAAKPQVAPVPPPPPPPPPPAPPAAPETKPQATPTAAPAGTPAATPAPPEPFENKVLDVPKTPAKTPGEVIEVDSDPAPSE